MRVPLRGAGALVTVVGCSVLMLAPSPASAAAVNSSAAHSQTLTRYNEGATHSPQLLSQLAHQPYASPSTSPSAGTTAPGTTSPSAGTMAPAATSTASVPGIDVASEQESSGINWTDVYQAGKRFAAIKATEGAYYTNKYALTDVPAARKAGLSVIAYAFAIPNGGTINGVQQSASPTVQADDLINFLSPAVSVLPPIMLDIEYDPYVSQDGTNECYGLSPSKMVQWIQGFAGEVQAKTGRLPIIYSTAGWWDTCTGDSVALRQDPLWIASYTTTGTPGSLPAGWTDWGMWQYTSVGTVSGISGNTDLDTLNADSSLVSGKLLLINPGYQQGLAGSSTPVTAQANAYALEASPQVTYTASGLPSSLSLNSSTGQITGTTPATAGAYPVTVTASDATTGVSRSVQFTWYAQGTLTFASPPPSQSTVAGSPVNLPVTATDSVASEQSSVRYSATGLPPGVSIDSSTGLLTGWPEVLNTYQVRVTAVDGLNVTASVSFSWTVSGAADAGPTGLVRVSSGGECLRDVGNGTSNGNPVEIWQCESGWASQQWTWAQDETVRIHGKCLTAPSHVGWKARLETCTGWASRRWVLVDPAAVASPAGSRPVTLYNPKSGLCLTDPGWSRANGTRLRAERCNGYTDQEWTAPAGHISSEVAGKCVDDQGGKSYNGNTVEMLTCDGRGQQNWQFKPDGSVRVWGKCLTVSHMGVTAGSKVWLWNCFGGYNQQWRLKPEAGGMELVNPASGLCLTDPGSSTTNGTQPEIEPCAPAQLGNNWRPLTTVVSS